ncbi:HNH endonuclease [Actinocatenispora thailandica]|uniref:HNH endonuclease n=1 Tax=Actinocatenispora thailandica TaxID=227318 RepID=UPI0031DE3991
MSSLAGQMFQPTNPELRALYPDGVYIDLRGFPDWIPYARAVVEMPPPPPGLAVDEVRVTDVLAANELLLLAADPLAERRGPVPHTPEGWVWAHLAGSRRLALVPSSLHDSFRHGGGVATLEVNRHRTGLELPTGSADEYVPLVPLQEVSEAAVHKVEEHLNVRLPGSYRGFVMATNGGFPRHPGVHPEHGFIVDQPFFGIARNSWFEELSFVNMWVSDRFTHDFLAVGPVQGGMIAVKVHGDDSGSVWYWDDDDRNDAERYDAEYICGHLLHRCGDDFEDFWASLRLVPEPLLGVVRSAVDNGHAQLVDDPDAGASLPPAEQP